MTGVTTASFAQTPPTLPNPKRIETPAQTGAIKLYPGKAPGFENAKQTEVWFDIWGQTMVRNVTVPTITPFLPQNGKGNGAAVLVVPGGGFQFASMSNEGWPIAQWLADRGVAAFVLKYRMEETPDADADFVKALMARFQPPRSTGPEHEMQVVIDIARSDAQTALKLIRANASAWGVDPKRVGMMGFSAGAMTILATALADAPDARPDFIAPIYGFMTAVTPPTNPQPMFTAIASNDGLFKGQGFGLIESWQNAGGSVELHFYQGGDHGFGSQKMGTTSDLWFEQYMAWMQASGLMTPAK